MNPSFFTNSKPKQTQSNSTFYSAFQKNPRAPVSKSKIKKSHHTNNNHSKSKYSEHSP